MLFAFYNIGIVIQRVNETIVRNFHISPVAASKSDPLMQIPGSTSFWEVELLKKAMGFGWEDAKLSLNWAIN